MRIDRFLKFLPSIEKTIEAANLDHIVMGLGPTAWLLPHMRQSLLRNIRFTGAHDAFRIRPVHDLVIFDQPLDELNPDSERHHHITMAEPERLFAYEPRVRDWHAYLPHRLREMIQPVPMHVWNGPKCTGHEPVELIADPIHTIAVSPTGCTTLAWKNGARRIGVIGADMMHGHHRSSALHHQVDAFFTKISRQAFDAGGLILNLSPVTSLQSFAICSHAMLSGESKVGS